MTNDTAAVAETEPNTGGKRYESPRGRFEFFSAPELPPPPTPEESAARDVSRIVSRMDYSDLLEKYDEEEIRDALGEMVKAVAPGTAMVGGNGTIYFQKGVEGGMSLSHAWFGPHYTITRHSHPRGGDCLYYVLAGELVMGNRVLKTGDGFFLPNGMPYKFRAGAEGVEVLEFRAGGGDPNAPITKLGETSLDGIRRITEAAKDLQEQWVGAAPSRVSEGSLKERTLDA